MVDFVNVVLLVALSAFAIWAFAVGAWFGTWAGSGRERSPRKYPGAPTKP